MSTTFETFQARASAVSAEVHRFPDREGALAFLLAFLRESGVGPGPRDGAVWVPGSFLQGLSQADLAAQVPGLAFEVTRDGAEAARVGVSQMDAGVAATGTLVQDASAVEKRLASTLPPIHVAIVPTHRVVESLGEVLEALRPEALAYVACITGPSRTADIERVLTIGVHGPERLVILAVDSLDLEAA